MFRPMISFPVGVAMHRKSLVIAGWLGVIVFQLLDQQLLHRATAAAADTLPLPPVHPTPPPQADRIMQEFKVARAAYNDAIKNALETLADEFPKARERVQKGEFAMPQTARYAAGATKETKPLPPEIRPRESKLIKKFGSQEAGGKSPLPREGKGGKGAGPVMPNDKAKGLPPRGGRTPTLEDARKSAEERMRERMKKTGIEREGGTKGPPAEIYDPIIKKTISRQDMVDRIVQGKADEANSSLHELDKQLKEFGARHDNFIPTHAAMAEAVAEYHRRVDVARAELAKATDKAIAAYKTAGNADPAKLRLLNGQRGVFQHPELMGVWERSFAGGSTLSLDMFRRQLWLVDIDQQTGDLQVDCLNVMPGSQVGLRHGLNVAFKDGGLSFVLRDMTPAFGQKAEEHKVTLTPRDGKLEVYCETGLSFDRRPPPASANAAAAVFRPGPNPKSDLLTKADVGPGPRREVAAVLREKTGIGARPGDGSIHGRPREVDLTDVNAVWREIAAMASFGYARGDRSGPYWAEQLYIPYSRRGELGGLNKVWLEQMADEAAGKDQDGERVSRELLRHYDQLANAQDPYLRRAADRAQTLFLARRQLALADLKFGNSAQSQLREIQKWAISALAFSLSRDADVDELRRTGGLGDDFLGTPMSSRSRELLRELQRGSGEGTESIFDAQKFSDFINYADFAEVDREVEFWQTTLLPLAKRTGRPPADKPLASVAGGWRLFSSDNRFRYLDNFNFRNDSGTELTNATIEIVAENQWGEKSMQYYYLPDLEIGEVAMLKPHFRFAERAAQHSPTINVTFSVWSDQGASIGQKAELKSPQPNPNPDRAHAEAVAFDKDHQAAGEAFGAALKNKGFLLASPERQKRAVTAAAAPGLQYAFNLAEPGKPAMPLLLRFLRVSPDNSSFEAEITVLKDKKPFKAEIPIWKGKLRPDDKWGYVLQLDSGWCFLIGHDDRPAIALRADKGTAVEGQMLALFATKQR